MTKMMSFYPKVDTNVCTKFHAMTFNSYWDISCKTTNVNLTVVPEEKLGDHQNHQDSDSVRELVCVDISVCFRVKFANIAFHSKSAARFTKKYNLVNFSSKKI